MLAFLTGIQCLGRPASTRGGALLAAIALLGWPLRNARAAEEEPPPVSAIGAVPSGVEEIVVYGQAASALVFEPDPIETQVLERIEIEALPLVSAADAVAKLPGIRSQQRIQGEQAAISIEGLPPDYTKILVDGQRYTGFVGAVADLDDVPLTNVDRIEILRGAQGLRQGPDAGGGVIDVRTRPLDGEPVRADVWGVAGSDEQRLLATTLGATGGPIGTIVSYTHDEIGGYDPRGSDAVFVNVGGKESRFAIDDVYVSQELAPDVVDRYGVHGFTRFGYRNESNHYVRTSGVSIGDTDTERWLGSVGSRIDLTDDIRADTALTYYQASEDTDVGRPVSLVDRELRGELSTSVTQDWGLTLLDFTLGLDARGLLYDLDEAPLDFTPTGNTPALTGDRSFDKTATTGGLFGLLEAQPTEWLILSGGLRYQLDTRYDPMLAPQVGVLVEPTRWLDLRFQYGRSDRYPSLNDLHQPIVAQLGGQYFLGGNPDLVPEKTDSYRAGFEVELGRTVALSATGFWNEIDGLIRHVFSGSIQVGENILFIGGEPVPDFCLRLPPVGPRPPVCSPVPIPTLSPVRSDLFLRQNLELVRTRGVESHLVWRPIPEIALRGGYTFMDTKVDSESLPDLEELPNEPQHTVDGEIRVYLPSPFRWLGDPQLAALGRWRSAALRETSGTGLAGFTSTERSNSSFVADLRLSVPIAERFTFHFDVRNLTDERTVDSYEIRGRTYAFGLRVRWPS